MTTVVACSNQVALEVGPGRVDDDGGKADGAAARAELKLTIDPADIGRARDELSLVKSKSQQREVWFFDTPALALYEAGTILRARQIDDDPDDSAVKLRPFTSDALAPEFRALEGMKCELDRLPATATSSCSLKAVQDKGEIAAVGDGERAIDKLFSSDQEALFAAYAPPVGWHELVALGPIPARVWTLRTSALPEKLTAELWYLPDGSQTLELSMKVAIDDVEPALAQLLGFVEERDLALDPAQESKTRRALETLTGVR